MQNNIFSGLFVGQNLVRLKEVDSTNNFLKNMASNSKPVPEGTVIMAEAQTAGRGQRDNTWHAEPGKNLTFSLLLNPTFLAVSQQFDLTRAISLGVYDALHDLLGDKLKIKWPNDIYYAGNKLGGMLIENMIQGGQIRHAIIGIGININQVDFPPSAVNATSLKQILQSDYDLTQILSEICSHIEGWYLKLRAGRVDDVRRAYVTHLYRLNESHQYLSEGARFTGSITGVQDGGMLVVVTEAGERTFNLKEIEFINN